MKESVRMFRFLLFAMCLFTASAASAQEERKEGQEEKEKKKVDVKDQSQTYAFDGTYQLEIINTRYIPYFPANLPDIIRDNRDETQVAYVKISDKLRVKILPKSEISAVGFKPLREKYVFVKE